MSYPFPYKTSDGLLVDNSTGPVVIPEIKTDEIIITQGYTDAYSISTSTGPPRGLIRTLDEAFGFDIDVQGTGKLIRLMTDDIVRTTVEDTKVTISNALDVLGQVKGITIEGTQLISTIATGTTPLLVTSTTVVPNLNVSQLLGNTWAIPGTIGSTTPSTGAFTTLTASSTITATQLISTVAIGTAPLTVTSTTVVPNLNVSQLLGNTWVIPGTIGSTTPNTGAFTTLTVATLQGAGTLQGVNDRLACGPSGTQNMFIDRNRTGGNFIFGYLTGKDTIENARFQVYNNQTDANLLFAVYSKGSSSGTDRVEVNTTLNVSGNVNVGGGNSVL